MKEAKAIVDNAGGEDGYMALNPKGVKMPGSDIMMTVEDAVRYLEQSGATVENLTTNSTNDGGTGASCPHCGQPLPKK